MAAEDHGRFCWYDLMTTDPEGSKNFYTRLFDWRLEATDMGDRPYSMFHAGDRPIGGLVPLREEDGLPTHWIPYVAVADIKETCEKVRAAGGEVCVPPTNVGPGTFAVLNDPLGAFFSLWETAEEIPPDAPKGTPGVFCWNECLSTDAEAGAAFYAAVMPWTVQTHEMEVGGMPIHYRTFEKGGEHGAGILELPHDAQEMGAKSHWLSYVTVDDVDAMLEKAQELGASVLCPPTDIPQTGRFAVIQDPQGGMLSLFKHAAENL